MTRSGRRIDVNGIRLNVAVTGEGPALLLLHGFSGSGATWAPFLDTWRGFTAIAVDLPGHGASDCPADPARYRMERCVEDLVALMDRLGVERTAALGYSMGGRVALHLALAAPERLSALVLESASPGIDDPRERAARRQSDEALAAAIERNGVEAFVSRWEAMPLFASQARLPATVREELRRQRLSSDAAGLAGSLRGMGAGQQEPLRGRLGEISVPTLVIAGEMDEKYSALARRMAAAMPDARAEVVAQAGHAVHLEQPEAFAAIVQGFLKECLSRTTGGGLAMTVAWQKACDYQDIIYEKGEGIAKITINRPEVRNAFRPKTLFEMQDAFADVRDDASVGVVILTGTGPEAFCSGGDQRVRGEGGYVGEDGVPRLNALDLQRQIRLLPKPVIAMVAGYAIGGGNVLALVCDLTIAAENAVFGQTGPRVGSFDAGYGATLMARIIGHKKAREVWYTCRQYRAQEALEMGLVNAVVPLEQLEEETVRWAQEMLEMSPTALRFLKAAFNADTDGLAGIQQLAGEATLLFYMSEEGKEGRNAFLEKRRPDFSRFPRLP